MAVLPACPAGGGKLWALKFNFKTSTPNAQRYFNI